MKYYKTGEFAKLANVTERTIRYYDKVGLLKPSFVLENGYRQYSDADLVTLQKILSLRHLGFSIEEIFPMISSHKNQKESFKMQIELIDQRMRHLQVLKDALEITIRNNDWDNIISLIQLTNNENDLIEHYKNANNLNVRISLHDQYSVNKQGWFEWLYEMIDWKGVNRLLEIGCGNGKLWQSHARSLRNREIFLSDKSQGMVEEVRKKLGNNFNCMVFECEKIPFKDSYFDAVVANHVLFYVNISQGLKEISRVLNTNGTLYCSCYGRNHMKEINEMVSEFDSNIVLTSERLYDIFGLDNGEEILKPYFRTVRKEIYEDQLIVRDAQPLLDYILSCHGNQAEQLGPRLKEFKKFIEGKLPLTITKEAGIFICIK